MRRLHPGLQPQRLRKSTLLALSWAIEDECCSRAERPMIFGAFQRERYYRRGRGALGRAGPGRPLHDGVRGVPRGAGAGRPDHVRATCPADAPMRREWAVVCDAPDHPAMLTAWELPGQSAVPDRDGCSRSCGPSSPAPYATRRGRAPRSAQQLGHPEGAPLLYELAENPPPPRRSSCCAAASLLNRVVAYVDRAPLSDGYGVSVTTCWREVLLEADALDRVELALEPVGVRLLVADHLLEDRGRAVVAEVVALLRAGVELRDRGLLAVEREPRASPRRSRRR